jgi:hypothetical protein
MYSTEDVLDLLSSLDQKPTLDHLIKFQKQRALEEVRNLSLSLRRGPWRFWSLLRGLDWLKLESRCFEDMTGMSSEHQKLDMELWGRLLVVRKFWRRRRRVLCLGRLQCFISSSHFLGLVHRHLYCWTLEMMIQPIRTDRSWTHE